MLGDLEIEILGYLDIEILGYWDIFLIPAFQYHNIQYVLIDTSTTAFQYLNIKMYSSIPQNLHFNISTTAFQYLNIKLSLRHANLYQQAKKKIRKRVFEFIETV